MERQSLQSEHSSPGRAGFCVGWSLPALTARATPRNAICVLLAVATCVHAIASSREGRENLLWGQAGHRQARSHPFAKLLKAALLGQENEAVTQTQNSKGRANLQPEVFTELLRDRELALFADLGCRHVFERRVMGRHIGRKILPRNSAASKHGVLGNSRRTFTTVPRRATNSSWGQNLARSVGEARPLARWKALRDWRPASLLQDAATWAHSRAGLPVSWQRLPYPDQLPYPRERLSGHPPSWSRPAPLRRQQSAQNPRPAGARHRSILRTRHRQRRCLLRPELRSLSRAPSWADVPWHRSPCRDSFPPARGDS